MRKGITNDPEVIVDILKRAEVLWLALADDQGPYCVPVSFAVEDGELYIHSGLKGRKATYMNSGGLVAFSAAVDMHMHDGGPNACDQGYHFRSVMGSGRPRLLDGEEKMKGLDAITRKHLGKIMPYKDKVLPVTAVYAIGIENATARIKE